MESFQVNLVSIPRMEFLDGNAGQAWVAARDALSGAGLEAKSPIYEVAVRGGSADQGIVQIPIPNDSQPYETLELYSWDGDSWEFVPSSVLSMDDRIEARISGWPPSNFAVMQTSAPPAAGGGQTLGSASRCRPRWPMQVLHRSPSPVFICAGTAPWTLNAPTLRSETMPSCRFCGTGGAWSRRAATCCTICWLNRARCRTSFDAVTNLLLQYSYPGVIVDYRGMDAAMAGEAEFSHFIERLAERLHAPDVNRWLAVRVESPQQVSPVDWNTRGYDWQALGRAADRVLIPGPADPAAYQLGGAMGSLLAFATDQIDRRKVQLELPGMSVERSEGQVWLKGFPTGAPATCRSDPPGRRGRRNPARPTGSAFGGEPPHLPSVGL